MSGNGLWMAFMSDENLVGYDTHDAHSSHPDEELNVFDAASGQLACASCEPTGARPTGSEYGLEGRNVLTGSATKCGNPACGLRLRCRGSRSLTIWLVVISRGLCWMMVGCFLI